MDLEAFYCADERRRLSEEVELGDAWTDASAPGALFQVAWVKDTGEVYSMREFFGTVLEDPFGDSTIVGPPTKSLTVAVLGTADDEATLDRILVGWQDAMRGQDGLSWLRDRLRTGLPAAPTTQPEPVEEGEERLPGAN